jgi:hypothetical protein
LLSADAGEAPLIDVRARIALAIKNNRALVIAPSDRIIRRLLASCCPAAS